MILSEAGWRSKSGGIVSTQVLRAMVSRIQRSQQTRTRPPAPLATGGTARPDKHRHSARPDVQTDHPAIADVAERIRRAAALRSGKGEH